MRDIRPLVLIGLWSSQLLVDTLSTRHVSGLELLRTHAAEMAVAAR
jgi:hypothetical protein